MKRLLVITMALLMVAPLAFGKKKRDKAGMLDGSTYQDESYGFSMKVSENWKVRIGDEKDKLRLVMTQKNYTTPPRYLNAKDYTKVPRIVMFVDTTNLPPMTFIDSLTSSQYKSEFKSTLLKEFEILAEPELVPRSRNPITIGEISGAVWAGQAKYVREISESSSSSGGVRVNGSYGGSIAAVKVGNVMVVFHMMCEWEYFDAVQGELMQIVNSMQLSQPKGE